MTKLEMEQKIQEVADKIVREFQPEKIILFGSWAWGEPTEDSDVDLFVVKDDPAKRIDRERELRSKIFSREFPAMDILVYTPDEIKKSINDYKNLFIEDILRNGKMLYTKSKSVFTITLPERPLTILH